MVSKKNQGHHQKKEGVSRVGKAERKNPGDEESQERLPEGNGSFDTEKNGPEEQDPDNNPE